MASPDGEERPTEEEESAEEPSTEDEQQPMAEEGAPSVDSSAATAIGEDAEKTSAEPTAADTAPGHDSGD